MSGPVGAPQGGWQGPALPPRPANAPPAFHLLAKPTGAICNLDCAYCFFLDKEVFYPGSTFRMDNSVLEQYLRQLIESHQGDSVNIAWQGGEPTMMGLDFYRRAMTLIEQYRRPGMTFLHTMQTNGTLLTDQWGEFLAEHNFLIGISIDGPRALHDVYRTDKGGKPTFDRVMRGLRVLQKHGVDFNILTTVNRVNGDHPLEVYRFLRDEAATTWMQFIPVVERINSDGLTIYQEGTAVSERSVLPEQFGRFLSTVFDEWVRHDVGTVYVQTFEAALRNWLQMGSSGMCVFNETCGTGLALEHNGDLFCCDHFVEPKYLLGNIRQQHLLELVSSPQQVQFGLDKRGHAAAVLPGVRRAVRLSWRVPEEPFRRHARRRGRPQLPLPGVQGLLPPRRLPHEADGGTVAARARGPRSDGRTGPGRSQRDCHCGQTLAPDVGVNRRTRHV